MGRNDEPQDLAVVSALKFGIREPDVRRSVLLAPVAVRAFIEPVNGGVFIADGHGSSIIEVTVICFLVLIRAAISAHDAVDRNDLQHGLPVGHIVGVAEPDLAVSHADPLPIHEHVEEILVRHGLPVALGHGLVQHIAEEGVCVGQLGAVDRNGVADHVAQGIPVSKQIGRAHVITDHRFDLGLVHGRDHGIVIRIGDRHHVGGGPPGIHGLDFTGFIFLRDGQRFALRVENCAALSIAAYERFGIHAAVALVCILRQRRVIEYHRKSFGVKAPAHDGLVMEPGVSGPGDGDLHIFRAVGLDQGLRAVFRAVDADEAHYGVLPGLFCGRSGFRKVLGLAGCRLLAAGGQGKNERRRYE